MKQSNPRSGKFPINGSPAAVRASCTTKARALPYPRSSFRLLALLLWLTLCLVVFVQSAHADHKITLYANGYSDLLSQDSYGELNGYATDVFACAMQKLGHAFETQRAPLSRSQIVLNQNTHALWFPASMEGSEERLERLVGPIGTVDVIWLTRKDFGHAVDSEAFRKQARVTAYSGSAMERWLLQQPYTYVKSSADRNRMFTMIMSAEVDAVLAVDFRSTLPADMQKLAFEELEATPYSSTPVGYRISPYLAQSRPNFMADFRRVLDDCR